MRRKNPFWELWGDTIIVIGVLVAVVVALTNRR